MAITIIDSGLGNIASVLNMIRKAGGHAVTSADPDAIAAASKLILPGVGAWDHGMERLTAGGLDRAIVAAAGSGTPVLGICLGMELLGTGSEEGDRPGLGLIDAHFRRFAFDADAPLRVPHVGWNRVRPTRANPLIPDEGEQRFYFTHSYHAVCARESDVLATATYGFDFPAAYAHERVFGVQFHPEKSHRFGLDLMRKFLEL